MSLFFKSVGCECPGCSSSPCDPPSVPASTFYYRTASASKTKIAYNEWFGYVSSPPKIYLRKTLAGGINGDASDASPCAGNCLSYVRTSYSGECNFDRFTLVETVGGNFNLKVAYPCTTILVNDNTATCTIDQGYPYSTGTTPGYNLTYSSTVETATGIGCTGSGTNQNFTGVATTTLGNEYTTALLISDVETALPAFSGPFTTSVGSPNAFYDLSTNELTATKRALEYKFELPALVALGYTSYRLDWVERFTPEGGSPSDTAKFYNWNGSATETGVYTVSAPSTQGTTSNNNIVASCS